MQDYNIYAAKLVTENIGVIKQCLEHSHTHRRFQAQAHPGMPV